MSKPKYEKLPTGIKHAETKYIIQSFIDDLRQREKLSPTCMPFIKLMASSYDTYLDTEEYFETHPRTYENKKGDLVPDPNVNIGKKAFDQFQNTAMQFGFTIKSASQIKSHNECDNDKYDATVSKWVK